MSDAASAVLPAVLLLAWNEAAPATRASLASLTAAAERARALLILPHAAPPAEPENVGLVAAPTSGEESAELMEPVASSALPSATPTAPAETQAALRSTSPAPAGGYSVVRVLRVADYSLAQLSAQAGRPLPGPSATGGATPAAPYRGSDAPPALELPATSSLPLVAPPTADPASLPADLAPKPVASLDLDAEIAPPTPSEGETPVPEDAPPSDAWPAALAALTQPTTDEPAAAAEATESAIVTQPDWPLSLNFEIIQYARFAVPLADAAGPFAVIYAPAWPTWLAALELAQRRRQPLVLHLHTVAAGPVPLDLAVGWAAEVQRQALRAADLVLVENYGLARRLYRELGLPAAAVRVVPATDATAIGQALQRVQRRAALPSPPHDAPGTSL